MPFIEHQMPFPTLEYKGDGTVTLHVPDLKIHITVDANEPQFNYETKETSLKEAISFWMQKNGIPDLATLENMPGARNLFESTVATLKVWVP